MIADHRSAEFGDVILKVDEILALLMGRHVIEVNVFVAPLEVVDYSFVGQLLLHNKDILEKVNNPLFNIKMVEFSDHGFLVFEVALVLVNQSVSFIDYVSDIVKDRAVCAHVEGSKLFG